MAGGLCVETECEERVNLTLSTACKQPQIRNAHGNVGEVAVFLVDLPNA